MNKTRKGEQLEGSKPTYLHLCNRIVAPPTTLGSLRRVLHSLGDDAVIILPYSIPPSQSTRSEMRSFNIDWLGESCQLTVGQGKVRKKKVGRWARLRNEDFLESSHHKKLSCEGD